VNTLSCVKIVALPMAKDRIQGIQEMGSKKVYGIDNINYQSH